VEWDFEGVRRKIRFLNPEFGMINIADRIPLHISAFAPRARRLTAEIADGWMTFMTAEARAIHEASEMARACRESGRDPSSLYRTVFALGCVLRDGETASSARAIAQAGPLAAVFFHGMVERLDLQLPPQIAPLAEEYRRQYAGYQPADAKYLQMHKMHLLGVRPEERKFITEDVIRMTTYTATAPELRERAAALKAGGFDQLTIQLVPGHESALEDWAAVFEKA
jgi:5,10-methylenetetrahydromethanopterin reductase